MKHRVLFASAILVGCGSTPPAQLPRRTVPALAARTMADEAFRAKPPLVADAGSWSPPPIAERTLPNGLRVLVVERHDVPIVAVHVVSDRGADQADRGIPEVWAQSILRAGVNHPWYDVRDDFDRMAVFWEATTRPDATDIELKVLSKLFVPTMKLVGDLVVKPEISDAELDRAKNRVMNQIQSADLKLVARRAMGRVFYPHGHPYNEPYAPSENVPKVTTDLVLAYHASAFTPAHTTIAISGDVDAEVAFSTIASAFGALAGAKLGPVKPPQPPAAPPAARIVIIDASATSQAYVTAAWFAPTLPSEDEYGLMFARQILTNSLYEDVRRDRGATYGLRMSTPLGRGTQLTRIEGYVQLDSVADAIKDVLADLDSLGHDPPTEEVMTWARVGAWSGITGLFEGPESTADALSVLAVRGAPIDYFAPRLAAVRKTSADDVVRVARKWLATDTVRFIVVGDASKLQKKLEKLGIGDVAVRSKFLP
ncbi:MAG: M16 family metallopeptidase [Polyangiales bacterium]